MARANCLGPASSSRPLQLSPHSTRARPKQTNGGSNSLFSGSLVAVNWNKLMMLVFGARFAFAPIVFGRRRVREMRSPPVSVAPSKPS